MKSQTSMSCMHMFLFLFIILAQPFAPTIIALHLPTFYNGIIIDHCAAPTQRIGSKSLKRRIPGFAMAMLNNPIHGSISRRENISEKRLTGGHPLLASAFVLKERRSRRFGISDALDTANIKSFPEDSRTQNNAELISSFKGTSSSSSSSSTNTTSATSTSSVAGLYRPFAERAWGCLMERCGHSLQPVNIPSKYQSNMAHSSPDSLVRISIQAMEGTTGTLPSPIRYARMALLESVRIANQTSRINDPDSSNQIQTTGIQVLNMVIFPNAQSDHPVWGADFVSLPGNKHLLLLDAQPMVDERKNCSNSNNDNNINLLLQSHLADWYEQNNIQQRFPWGGEMPEQVKPYISPSALWTRLGDLPQPVSGRNKTQFDSSVDTTIQPPPPPPPPPIEQILGLMPAFEEHLNIYLDAVLSSNPIKNESLSIMTNGQNDYIKYRLNNDPARPMLKRLYGDEWTEKVLHEVLFPLLAD